MSDRSGFGSDRGERGGFGAARNFDSASDAGSERGNRRPAYEQGDGKVRDFGNWERKGPLTPTIPNGPSPRSMERPSSHEGPRDRKNSPAWGEGRSQEGSRPPRKEFAERPAIDRAPTAPELDNQWRSKMRPDPPAAPPTKSPTPSFKELSVPSSPAAPPAPTTRPRLNLQKRTVSDAEKSSGPTSAVSDAKASPFGAAKPVDTFAKEKEVEEKRQVALRQKKEAEDKAREEKRVADEKAREEKRLAKETERNEKTLSPKDKPNGVVKEKENGVEAPPPGKSYEILRRATNEDTAPIEEEAAEIDGKNGLIQGDKETKPQEIIRDIPSKKTENGNVARRNGAEVPQPDASAGSTPTADSLEEDGWSTVSKPQKGRKGGNQAARAIAS